MFTRYQIVSLKISFLVVLPPRVCVLALVGISILWVPIIQASQGSQLFVYIQQVSSFLQPPVCAVYILSVFWARINEPVSYLESQMLHCIFCIEILVTGCKMVDLPLPFQYSFSGIISFILLLLPSIINAVL